MQILIAEDDRISRQALEALVRKWGYAPVCVEDGLAAWDVLRAKNAPQLAILDWNMPGMTGLDVCRNARRNLGGSYSYLIMLTARDRKQDIAEGIEAGADDYIIKPFDAKELRARLRAAGRILDLQQELLGVQGSLRASQAELSAIFTSAPTAIFVVDSNLQVRNANPAATELANRPLSEMIGRKPGEAMGCEHASRLGCGRATACEMCQLRSIVRDLVSNGCPHHRGEASLLRKSGHRLKQFHFHVTSAPLRVGSDEMVLLCLEDVTERKAAERELEILNETLESQVQDRTAKVQQLLKQKDQFVNQLGHDLKTPLTPLVALLPMLSKRVEDERSREILNVAMDNVRYMRKLVEKTLSLARLNSSAVQFDMEPVDLLVETRNIVASMGPILSENQLHVENNITDRIVVRADRVHLREVFHNIISNATKYTPPGGKITLTATVGDDAKAYIAITDTGCGMNPDQLDRVFLEFHKADESRHDRSSIGLGLSICQCIVQRHGGKIWATSPGIEEGSTLTFSLPLAGKEVTVCTESDKPNQTGQCQPAREE
jgi:signal transduction histidine kinase/DNA-binding response OmpR family regulator